MYSVTNSSRTYSRPCKNVTEIILNRVPLHAPFFWDKARQAAWDTERKPAKARGWFLYNDDVAFDLYR